MWPSKLLLVLLAKDIILCRCSIHRGFSVLLISYIRGKCHLSTEQKKWNLGIQSQTSRNKKLKRGLYSAMHSTNSSLLGMNPLYNPVCTPQTVSIQCVSVTTAVHTHEHMNTILDLSHLSLCSYLKNVVILKSCQDYRNCSGLTVSCKII